MTVFAIKRVYEPVAKSDGKRILVDRLWPRGLRKQAAQLDDWLKVLAPSPALRKWFGHKPERFTEFKRRYKAELKANPDLKETVKSLRGRKITLLYGAKDPEINHAVVLAQELRRRKS
jgi:uncharacterized protein YeaO (DUF488 family)